MLFSPNLKVSFSFVFVIPARRGSPPTAKQRLDRRQSPAPSMDKRLGHKKPSPVSTTAAAKERKKIAFQITSRKSAMTNPSAVLSKKGHGSSSSGSSDSSGSDSESSYSSSSSTSSREKVTSTSKSGGRREKGAAAVDTAAAKVASKKVEMLSRKRTAQLEEVSGPPKHAKVAAVAQPSSTSPPGSGKTKTTRREELLKQLKAVEDAIKRKRSKIS
jgi:hypothetical protein